MPCFYRAVFISLIVNYVTKCTGIDFPTKQVVFRNPIYPAVFANKWWRDLGKPVLTIGIHGVKQSHLNYIADNIWHNHLMKIKTSSSKMMSPVELCKLIALGDMKSPLKKNFPIEIILIKGREIMIGKLKASMELLALWESLS